MTRIRKERAGSDSFGNTWPEDGAVVDVEPEHVASLLEIPDGGFSEVTPVADDQASDDDGDQDPGDDEGSEKQDVSEVDPDAPKTEPEAKPAAKKTPARKTAASKTVQE